MARRRRAFGLLAVLALLLSVYAFVGAAMDGAFYTSSREAQFLLAGKIWTAVMLISVIVAIGLAIAAWRTGRS